jgi:hypothetical protein
MLKTSVLGESMTRCMDYLLTYLYQSPFCLSFPSPASTVLLSRSLNPAYTRRPLGRHILCLLTLHNRVSLLSAAGDGWLTDKAFPSLNVFPLFAHLFSPA